MVQEVFFRLAIYMLSYFPWGIAAVVSVLKGGVENLWIVDLATFSVFAIWLFTELGADDGAKEKLVCVSSSVGISMCFDFGVRLAFKLEATWRLIVVAVLFVLALTMGCYLITKNVKAVSATRGKLAYFNGARMVVSVISFAAIGAIASFEKQSSCAVYACLCVCLAFVIQALFYHTAVKSITKHNYKLYFLVDVVIVSAFTVFTLMQYDLAPLLFVGIVYTGLVPKAISYGLDKI